MTTFGALEYDPEVFHPTNRGYGNDSSPPNETDIFSPTLIKNDQSNDNRLASPRSSIRTMGGEYDHL